jgi:DNA-binding NtrC family response regulator
MPINSDQETLVLVMNQGDEDARLISSTLEKAGFHVATSSDEAGALQLCRTSDPSPQVVIVDTTTRGLETSVVLEHLWEIDPSIRVLLMADAQSDTSRNLSFTANVRGRIQKPFRRARLLGSVLEITREPLVRTA